MKSRYVKERGYTFPASIVGEAVRGILKTWVTEAPPLPDAARLARVVHDARTDTLTFIFAGDELEERELSCVPHCYSGYLIEPEPRGEQ